MRLVRWFKKKMTIRRLHARVMDEIDQPLASSRGCDGFGWVKAESLRFNQ